MESDQDQQPESALVVQASGTDEDGEYITQPAKLMRIASMTQAMLREVREVPLDEPGRRRLQDIHERLLTELCEILSEDLRSEITELFVPLHDVDGQPPSPGELRIAQAQLVGWLEGLFHGIQASLFSQQLAAQNQLQEVRARKMLEGGEQSEQPGLYL